MYQILVLRREMQLRLFVTSISIIKINSVIDKVKKPSLAKINKAVVESGDNMEESR